MAQLFMPSHSFAHSLTFSFISSFLRPTTRPCAHLEIHKQLTILSSPHLTPRIMQLREEAQLWNEAFYQMQAAPLLGGHKYTSKHRILLKEMALSLPAMPHATSSRQISGAPLNLKQNSLFQRHSTGLTSRGLPNFTPVFPSPPGCH